MAALKFLNLLTISTLAILACSFTASPVNALAGSGHHNVGRSPIRGHDSIAKRKRDTSSKRCKPRSASSAEASTTAPAPETTSQAAVTTTKAAASTTKAAASTTKAAATTTAKPHTTSSASHAVATTSAASSSSSSGNNGSGKGGLAWPNGNQSYLKNFKTSKVNYLYTWSPELPDNCWSLGFNCIPMLWGENQLEDFSKKVVKGYANIALGFNEPNESGQSNMTPDRGAELWKQYLAPLRSQGYQLGSPATSSNPNGFTWVQNFVSACNGGCEFDFVALHWYDVKATDFIAYVEKWHNGFNKPVMVTEYACQNFNGGAQCSKDDIFSFMSTVNSWMDSTDYVLAYFPFGVMGDMQGVNDLDRLMTSSGSPTDLGFLFINP